MIVVSDTSPLRYLIAIGQIDLLRRLFGQIHCPDAVRLEACHPGAPASLREFFTTPPSWLVILPPSSGHDPTLSVELDPGEAEAIWVAKEMRATLLLMDERRGRRAATARGLRVAGTLNLLAEASGRGIIDYRPVVAQLRQETNFRATDAVVEEALRRTSQDV